MAVGRKMDRKGRSKGGPPFVKMEWWMFDSPAYRSLGTGPRALLWELIRRFNGSNNGAIGMGEREAVLALGMKDRQAVRNYFGELEEKGFIHRERIGAYSLKAGDRRASEWMLTWLPTPDGRQPSRAFMRWRPDGAELDSRDRKTTRAGQDSCHGAVADGCKQAVAGQETYPGKRVSGAIAWQESSPYVDLPYRGGSRGLAQGSERVTNG